MNVETAAFADIKSNSSMDTGKLIITNERESIYELYGQSEECFKVLTVINFYY